jgi:tetratricopeptide (TPR) repeat protein
MSGMWDQTAHPLDYQQYALLQQGRMAEAQKIVEIMRTSPAADINVRAAAYGFASTSARQAVETEDWKAAAALVPQSSKERDADANIYLARAMGNVRTGNADAARKDVEQLVEIEKSISDPYWKGQAEIKRVEGQAMLAFVEGRGDEALNLAREAAAKEDATDKNPVTPGALRPAHEIFADLLLEMKQYSAAAKEYQASLQMAPGRYRALYGAAKASELAGDRENARKYYAELLKVAEKGDARPELEAAKKFVSSEQVATK